MVMTGGIVHGCAWGKSEKSCFTLLTLALSSVCGDLVILIVVCAKVAVYSMRISCLVACGFA